MSKPAKSNVLSNVIVIFQNDLVWLFMPLTIHFMMCTKVCMSSTPLQGIVANTKKGYSSPMYWDMAAEHQQLCGEMVFSKSYPSVIREILCWQ